MQRPVCHARTYEHHLHGQLFKYVYIYGIDSKLMLSCLLVPFSPPIACPVNWKASVSSPLTCEMCQDRSERPMSESIANCICVTGYQMKSSGSDCFGKHATLSCMYTHMYSLGPRP